MWHWRFWRTCRLHGQSCLAPFVFLQYCTGCQFSYLPATDQLFRARLNRGMGQLNLALQSV